MKKIIILGLIFIFQIGVPVSTIVKKNYVLKNGVEVKFEVRPIDPYDAFRGKYLTIKVDNYIKLEKKMFDKRQYIKNQEVYVSIIKKENGFFKFNKILTEKPETTDLYLKTKIDYIFKYSKKDFVDIRIEIPFNRFYINEDYAKAGEKLYKKYSSGKPEDAYIIVRLKGGDSVLDKLYFKNIEANKYIKSEIEMMKKLEKQGI